MKISLSEWVYLNLQPALRAKQPKYDYSLYPYIHIIKLYYKIILLRLHYKIYVTKTRLFNWGKLAKKWIETLITIKTHAN